MPNIFSPQYTNYQPQYQQQYQQQYQMPQQQVASNVQSNNHNTSVVWVQGLAGAQAYPVAAGNTMMLMDSEDSVFYMKSTDPTGRPLPLRTFEFSERKEGIIEQPKVDLTNYVTWEAFEKRLDELEAKKHQPTQQRGSSNAKSAKRNDE